MFSAFIGIAIIALPSGIITAGYMDAINGNVNDKEVPADGSTAHQIGEFKQLLDEGAITQEDYNAKKAQLLAL